MTVMTPVIYAVNVLSSGFLRLVHVDPNRKQEAITEDELRTIVEVSHEEGVIESEEKKIINNVLDVYKRQVHQRTGDNISGTGRFSRAGRRRNRTAGRFRER